MLDAEIQRILDLGVKLELERQRRRRARRLMREGGFDAAFLAVGAHLAKRAYIPAGGASQILDAVSLLRGMDGAGPPLLGRRVVVYGGGNTAIDAARTAKRLGAEEAVIVYRRTREKMPAHDFELEEALQEGIQIKWLTTIKRADAGKLMIERMELDETGFPQPTGEVEELDADTLVLALGQDTDLSLLEGVPGIEVEDGVVKVDPNMMTGHPGIFAGGDMVPAERTVTVAIGHGKRAARHIDALAARAMPMRAAARGRAGRRSTCSTPGTTPTRRRPCSPQLDAVRRTSTFDEVVRGLDESTALFEARRCMSCGNCFACDNCYGVCPDNAVIKLDPPAAYAYEFDLDFCKGCGLCAQECPCGAIQMQPETI